MVKRIALLGNCQTEVLKDCLEPLTGAEVTLFPYFAPQTIANVEAIAEQLAGFDAVVSHPNPPPALARLSPELLSETMPVLSIPRISFTGYHPDFHQGPGSSPRSPLGIYHSAIVLGCFLAGLPERRVRAMFNSYTYARLGYFEEFGKSKAFLLKRAKELGFDLASCIPRWAAAGSFMHSPNHPKIHVLADLARLIAEKLGLPFDPTMPLQDYIGDRLLGGVAMPVYPEIAARLGTPGSFYFKHYKAMPGLESKIVSLDWLIAASYIAYPQTDWTDCSIEPALTMRDMLHRDNGYLAPKRWRSGGHGNSAKSVQLSKMLQSAV